MDFQLSNKRALVTGGSRGMGKAVAYALGMEGVDVALLARDEQTLLKTAKILSDQTGRRIVGVCADTRSEEAVHRAVAQAEEALGGGIDILVNAAAEPAGYAAPPALAEITSTYLHTQMDVKVMGYLRAIQAVVPGMQRRGWGRIINISGLVARSTGNAVGSVRNVAVAALSKNLADELGPQGINVNVVHPGLTVTERTPEMISQKAKSRGLTEDQVRAELDATNSTRQLVSAQEVADVVAFLASPRSRAINGDAIAVGGGVPGSIYY